MKVVGTYSYSFVETDFGILYILIIHNKVVF